MCRGNKIVFVCLLRCMIFFVCTSPASCLASTIRLVQFSVRFCCCGSVFFFRIEFMSLFRCSRFPCWFARHLQRWCIFQELLVTLGGLGIVGMYTFESSASRLVLLWLVLSHFPRLFVSPAPPSLAPAWSRMVFAWATAMDSRFFEYVVLGSLGLRAS